MEILHVISIYIYIYIFLPNMTLLVSSSYDFFEYVIAVSVDALIYMKQMSLT
jgi:hypothetical protein